MPEIFINKNGCKNYNYQQYTNRQQPRIGENFSSVFDIVVQIKK